MILIRFLPRVETRDYSYFAPSERIPRTTYSAFPPYLFNISPIITILT